VPTAGARARTHLRLPERLVDVASAISLCNHEVLVRGAGAGDPDVRISDL
jgi:hypothetical protein